MSDSAEDGLTSGVDMQTGIPGMASAALMTGEAVVSSNRTIGGRDTDAKPELGG